MERDKEFINVACLSHDAWTSTWCSSLNSSERSFVLNVVWSSLLSTNIICCARIIDANCIFILVHNISSGLISLRLRSEEHTSELQSRGHLVCRLLLEK